MEFGIWDERLSENEAYHRYMLFKKVTFDLVPKEDWHLFYRDLLEFERFLVNGTAIGYCGIFPFTFPVVDPTPFRQKPSNLTLD